jgi:Rod binding domain-containing protein
MSDLNSLTPLPAVLPADVRNGGKEARDTYQAALNFEQMLVKQLTKSLSDSAAIGGGKSEGGDDSDGGSESPQAYRDMISDNIATAISQSGGLGIADSLYKHLRSEKQS